MTVINYTITLHVNLYNHIKLFSNSTVEVIPVVLSDVPLSVNGFFLISKLAQS